MERSVSNYLTIILLALIWGSSFILMKRGLEVFDFVQVANLRIVIAFFSLTPFFPRAIRSFRHKHFFPIIVSALFGTAIPAFLFSKAQTQLDSALIGILNATVPLFTLILGCYFFKAKPLKANIIGVLIGFFGVILLTFKNLNESVIFNSYVLLVIIATVCYAISINVIKFFLYDLNPSSITALVFLFIGPFATIYLFNTNFLYDLQAHQNGYKAFGYIALLAVFGTSIATIIFNRLLNRSSAIFVASVTYLIPIVAIFWGVLDGEIITIYYLIGFTTILSGVYLVNKKLVV